MWYQFNADISLINILKTLKADRGNTYTDYILQEQPDKFYGLSKSHKTDST